MKRLVFFMLLLILTACSRNDGVPGDIIPKEQMQKILWDMIQADQFSGLYLEKDSAKINYRKETIKLYSQIFKINNTTKEEFQKSYQYYLGRPDITHKMLDTLSERARRLRLKGSQKPFSKNPK